MVRGRCRCACCTFVLHVASSSRSQVRRSSNRPNLWVVLLRLSMVVRGSPCKDVAIVTQLVTQAAHRCLVAVDSCHGVAKLPLMRRILLGAAAAVLLLAVGTRAADELGVGGVRLRCGCVETCWCKRPGLTVFRWVTPGRWHHIGLTAEEKQSHHSQG
jgi:hypothetical protein